MHTYLILFLEFKFNQKEITLEMKWEYTVYR